MKYAYGPVAINVKCDDCDWTTESYKNGQAIAKKHAAKHGHRVCGQLVIAFEYDGRKEASSS